MKILIAEDDQVLADGLLRTLRKGGYAVEHVASGSEADAALADHEFDLVILDLQIGNMGGMAACMDLRLDESVGRLEHVPVGEHFEIQAGERIRRIGNQLA